MFSVSRPVPSTLCRIPSTSKHHLASVPTALHINILSNITPTNLHSSLEYINTTKHHFHTSSSLFPAHQHTLKLHFHPSTPLSSAHTIALPYSPFIPQFPVLPRHPPIALPRRPPPPLHLQSPHLPSHDPDRLPRRLGLLQLRPGVVASRLAQALQLLGVQTSPLTL